MTLKIHHMALWSALALLIALASPALAQSGSTVPASTFGDVRYGAADPIHLGKEPKPLYQVDAYFRIKDLREIAARDKGLYVVRQKSFLEAYGIGRDPRPLYDVGSYFRIKDLREIAARDRGLFIVPSETGQEPRSLGKPPKPMRVIDTPYRSKELREIGSREKEGVLIPSKIWA
ncbi:hypothetical protein [Candidatus Methanocrinis natronophilus]|uniref:Uncharacterized protein n=1 Tax=Candidatus Methanocrinis natronophilus TaxID=3033396 RepID=A0ABT5X9U0_9EURY|nr:hypothetical protein [Candidatus Methanocrinis natronophilus]MDF0591465.1 hypothetical protein [Candidatus Methanocrinis natronophilus]